MNENYQTPLFRIAFDDPSLFETVPETIPSSIHERNRNETNLIEQREERGKKERRQGAYIRGFHWSLPPPPIPRGGTLVFTGVRERDLSAPWEHEKCRSQPTNFWFTVDERQRERGREKEQDFSEAWKLIDRRTRLSLFRDGGTPTHLLRLLFVAASSPVKTN